MAIKPKLRIIPSVQEQKHIEMMNKLAEWDALKNELTLLKIKESNLRMECAQYFFPSPKEGCNSYLLGNDYELKLTHKLNYKIDDDELKLFVMSIKYNSPDWNIDNLIKYLPTLIKSGYNLLPQVRREQFDKCLTISPATPAMEIKKKD